MLLKISHMIVSAWSRENIISKGSEDAYIYGVQLLLSTVINIFCIALISAILDRPFAWIPFLVGFIPLRITSGGFHAKTPLTCSLFFCGSFFMCSILYKKLSGDGILLSILISSITTLILVYLFSPVPARNKPLSDTEKKRNRSLSLATATSLLLVVVTSIRFNLPLTFSLYITSGEIIASIFLCLGMIEQLRKSN